MNEFIALAFALGIMYVFMIHLAYFLFGGLFKIYYDKEFDYKSIWWFGFNFKEEKKE